MEETESRPTMDFRSHILTELALSERIIRKGMGVAPRFTVFAPDGLYTAMVELPDGEQERSKQLSAIRGFMIFKAARGFLLASEIIDPDVISVIAVRRSEVIGALKHINRDPLSFGKTEWFGRENCHLSHATPEIPLPKPLKNCRSESASEDAGPREHKNFAAGAFLASQRTLRLRLPARTLV